MTAPHLVRVLILVVVRHRHLALPGYLQRLEATPSKLLQLLWYKCVAGADIGGGDIGGGVELVLVLTLVVVGCCWW